MSTAEDDIEVPLSAHGTNHVLIRGQDLNGLLHRYSFTELLLLALTGAPPSADRAKIVNAVLGVALEAGFTPSAAADRVPFKDTTDSLQAGVGTGLLSGSGGLFAQAETVARWLDILIANPSVRAERARQIVATYKDTRRTVPGFGHHLHRGDDPRARALIELAADLGVPGFHLRALATLADALEDAFGQVPVVNAAGAIAAVLGEAGIPAKQFGPLGVTARAAGLATRIATSRRGSTGGGPSDSA
ncbi:MAG: citrate/2-methylcitrate synthase [Pseudomonadota bacterium]